MSFLKSKTYFSHPIHTQSGVVSNLHNELLEYVNSDKPTHDHSTAYYQRFYISKFDLGDQAIEAKFSTPMVIRDGDNVIVSGYLKNSAFQVLAYANKTQQLTKSENWIVLGLGAIFFLAVVIGLLNSDLLLEDIFIPKLFLAGFTLVALYMGYRALVIREAIGLLQ